MKKIILIGLIGLLSWPVSAAQKQNTKVTVAVERQVNQQESQRYAQCDQIWLKQFGPKVFKVLRDVQEPRQIYLLGVPLVMEYAATYSNAGGFARGNDYKLKRTDNLCKSAEFEFSIRIYEERNIHKIVDAFYDEYQEYAQISSLDQRNEQDIMLAVKVPFKNSTSMEISRFFVNAEGKVMSVSLHWRAATGNIAQLFPAFFKALKSSSQAVFASHFVDTYCVFGEESYCNN